MRTVETRWLKAGDKVMTGETVVKVVAGAKTPKRKKEVTLVRPDGVVIEALWGSYTKIGVIN